MSICPKSKELQLGLGGKEKGLMALHATALLRVWTQEEVGKRAILCLLRHADCVSV